MMIEKPKEKVKAFACSTFSCKDQVGHRVCVCGGGMEDPIPPNSPLPSPPKKCLKGVKSKLKDQNLVF